MAVLTPGSGLVLRPYQTAALTQIRQAFRRHRWVLYSLPTGGGKTVLFCHAAVVAAAQGFKAAVIVHRVELVQQVAETLAMFGVDCGLVAAGEPENLMSPVQVCLINSLYRRVRKGRYHNTFRLVVVDECHHAAAKMWHETVPAILADKGRVLGVSATPQRTDGAGLDQFPDGVPAFETLITGPDIAELVETGFLCPALTFIPPVTIDASGVKLKRGDYDQAQLARATLSQTAITGDCIQHYQRLAQGRPMLAFCASLEHSKLVAQTFREAGIAAAHVDYGTALETRRAAVADIAAGGLKVPCNYALFSEGLDCPGIIGVIHLRKTASFGLYRQMNGRGLRIAPGKTKALIIDHAGNAYTHGLYNEPVQWTLAGNKKKTDGDRDLAAPMRRCPECGAANRISAASCEGCGLSFAMPRKGRIPEIVDGQLEQVRDELTFKLRRMSYPELLHWAGGDRERLTAAALAWGYKAGWIYHRQREHAAGQ